MPAIIMSMTDRNRPFPPPGAFKSRGEALQRKGAKRVRKAIKNARGLISELFQREKLSSWYETGRSKACAAIGIVTGYLVGKRKTADIGYLEEIPESSGPFTFVVRPINGFVLNGRERYAP